ncbi:esterase [Siccirubricoccus sp. KC 17139]|uniref:Esterase n=1 Tax=Siccirubricoccus soli TaxID=2899147 RepID=A0ABT1D3T1_9PROT|nr:esterase [Siccirubricoccus soli]MCO6416589.1 esterase [Siccirubricoccus soli]MCP2682724.1 esterase [Siccirubricoccus soli]
MMRWMMAALLAIAAPAFAQAPLEVREIGSLHVGGRIATLSGLPQRQMTFSAGAPPVMLDPNGEFQVEQMYAQYVKLANPRARFPLLLWHGGGLTGVTWETTPDGRPGWQMFFLRAGHDVYVSDAMERGRSGWARFPEILPGEPVFRPLGEGWSLFRLGEPAGWNRDPARRVAHAESRFPIAAWDQFMKQGVPRWATTDRQIQAAYDAYVQAVCPCVVVVHSQGGNFGFNAVLHAPDKIRALIAVEPSGAPDEAADAARVKGVPHLVVWGDYVAEHPFWSRARQNIERWQARIREAGGTAETLDLPAEGVRGNSHMLMMDTNSDEIATRVQGWMAAKGLMR